MSEINLDALIHLHLQGIEVKIDGLSDKIDEKFDDVRSVNDDLKKEIRALEDKVQKIEVDAARDRTKLAAIVGAIGIIAGGLSSFIVKLFLR